MECIEGQTLKEKLAAGPVPLNEALEIGCQIGQGLRCAHRHGILHRDIKPANIMVTPDSRVKITDFGVAKLSRSALETAAPIGSDALTETGLMMGTPPYMSPEQAKGKAADEQSDIWSLGVVMYEMVTGRRPFEGETGLVVLRAVLDDQPEPVTALVPNAPAELDRTVFKALAKHASDRYRRGGEIVSACKE